MVDPLRFALVGCGRISGRHIEALRRLEERSEARLVAVCDIRPERARAKGEECRVPYYRDYHLMMREHPEIDVVNVLTPTGFHAREVVALAPYGKHIVVEKPMALTVEDCDAMMHACDEHGCRLFVVKQNRYNPAVVALRTAFEAGRFGKLVLGTVRVRWCREQSYYDQDDWRGTWQLDGGVLSQQASHHVDLLQWFMGPIETVQCMMATRLVRIEAEDTAVATLRFVSGALGVIEATTAARPSDLEGSLSILGEKGAVVLGGFAVNKIVTWQFKEKLAEDDWIAERASSEVPNVYGFGHGPYLAHVVDAIRNRKQALVDGIVGRKNVEILSALYESAATGAPVHLAYRARRCPLGRPRGEPLVEERLPEK